MKVLNAMMGKKEDQLSKQRELEEKQKYYLAKMQQIKRRQSTVLNLD